jgi:hypothetical protein
VYPRHLQRELGRRWFPQFDIDRQQQLFRRRGIARVNRAKM